jgi:hypothetical protein
MEFSSDSAFLPGGEACHSLFLRALIVCTFLGFIGPAFPFVGFFSALFTKLFAPCWPAVSFVGLVGYRRILRAILTPVPEILVLFFHVKSHGRFPSIRPCDIL